MAISESVLRNEAVKTTPVLPPTIAARRSSKTAALLLLVFDAIAVTGVWLLAFAIWGHGPVAAGLLVIPLTVIVALSVAATQSLYGRRMGSTSVREMRRLLYVASVAALAMIAFSAAHPSGPWIATAGVGALLTFVALASVRGCYDEWVRAERAMGRMTRPVIVIGSNGEAAEMLDLFTHHPELGYRVVGLVGDRHQAEANDVTWLGDVDGAIAAVQDTGVDEVIISPNGVSSTALSRVVRVLLDRDVHVQLSSGFSGVASRRLHSVPLAHEPFFSVKAMRISRPYLAGKRIVDGVVGSTVLLISLPVLALASLAILLESRRPILFRQTRIGLDGRPFVLFKLRTMVTDAEARLAEVAADNQRHGPLFKLDADPRVTRVGRVLRATSLDEVPQLWNVLRGDMSLVGPRPALPDEVERFDADLHNRHRMKPGVTGLWQIEARDNPSFYAYRHLDLFYVENWSPLFDVAILLRTVPSVVVRVIHSLLGRTAIREPQKGALNS